MLAGLGPYLLGVAFWMFVGVVSIAGLVTDYQKRRLNVELLRIIIEKGQALDPALVTKLVSPEALDQRIDPLDLKLGGIITTASGVGICLMSYFISRLAPVALYPMLAGGTLTIFVGLGLMIGAKVIAEAREHERLNKSTP
ncbi:MAG TPA: hypothetical protein VGI32_18205 [Steroidobacteraceae bacterium]|jgi:hypothetical protein